MEEGDWHPVFLGEQTANYNSLIRQLVSGDSAQESRSADLFARAAINRELMLSRLAGDVELLTGTRGIQAYCLECPVQARPADAKSAAGMIEVFRALTAK